MSENKKLINRYYRGSMCSDCPKQSNCDYSHCIYDEYYEDCPLIYDEEDDDDCVVN